MNILAVDIGNTRTKWKLFFGEPVSGVFSRPLPSAEELAAISVDVDAVVCGSVRGGSFNDDFSRRCKGSIGKVPLFLSVQSTYGALQNGYESPDKMGVDRWLAMVAAWNRIGSALVVVDLGTAVTIDVIDVSGKHEGGYIVPGLHTLVGSLNSGTGLIAVERQATSVATTLGVNTAAAVTAGCAEMLVSFILAESRKRPGASLLLTGGGAGALLKYLPEGVQHVPDLVLDGIFLAAESER